MTSTVVVGFVESPEGRAALAAAADEAELRHARLVVVNSSRGGNEDAHAVISVRDQLARALAGLSARGLDAEVLECARGNDPAGDLLDIATERQAGLVVIGLRRRSPVGKFIMGSNAQDILLSADCPVLAVKADS